MVQAQVGKHAVRIHGVPVLGDRHAIPEVAARTKVKLVILAMPTAPGKAIREIVGLCEGAGLQTKIVPGLYELLGGTVSVSQLRPVQIDDLLRREPVQTIQADDRPGVSGAAQRGIVVLGIIVQRV